MSKNFKKQYQSQAGIYFCQQKKNFLKSLWDDVSTPLCSMQNFSAPSSQHTHTQTRGLLHLPSHLGAVALTAPQEIKAL